MSHPLQSVFFRDHLGKGQKAATSMHSEALKQVIPNLLSSPSAVNYVTGLRCKTVEMMCQVSGVA